MYYRYPQVVDGSAGAIRPSGLLLEINSFANPYPYQVCPITSMITEFLHKQGQEQLIEQYDMQSFEVKVLDKKRTLTEKLVSLVRCSLADDYMQVLAAKTLWMPLNRPRRLCRQPSWVAALISYSRRKTIFRAGNRSKVIRIGFVPDHRNAREDVLHGTSSQFITVQGRLYYFFL